MRYEATLRASRRPMACVILTSTVHGKRLRSATGCCSLNLTMCCASLRSGRQLATCAARFVQISCTSVRSPEFDIKAGCYPFATTCRSTSVCH